MGLSAAAMALNDLYSQCLMNAPDPLKSLGHSGPSSKYHLISKNNISGLT